MSRSAELIAIGQYDPTLLTLLNLHGTATHYDRLLSGAPVMAILFCLEGRTAIDELSEALHVHPLKADTYQLHIDRIHWDQLVGFADTRGLRDESHALHTLLTHHFTVFFRPR
ncbi:MAG: hypothetical protein NDI90_02350 [Nitrospira sp. BO4]|jgi:hypothetical protein|nr:hypothetical protein [Nitrospira sp. BO4]